jgi:hypothetical protein
VTLLPQTVTGAVMGSVVPLPDTGPLLLPDPFDPVVPPGPPGEPGPPGPVEFPQVPLEVPLAAVTELPHTVTGAVMGSVVPLPDTGPLLLPDPFDPVVPPGPPGEPGPPGPVEFPQVPLEVPPRAVMLLPQTVTGAVTGAVVPLPDTGPLLLPDPFDPVVPLRAVPRIDERSPQVPLAVPLPTVAPLPQTVTGAPMPMTVPLPETAPLLLPLPLEPVRFEPAPVGPAPFPQVPLP